MVQLTTKEKKIIKKLYIWINAFGTSPVTPKQIEYVLWAMQKANIDNEIIDSLKAARKEVNDSLERERMKHKYTGEYQSFR